MWELLLRMILDALTENRGVQVEFYNRFQHTVEVRSCRRPVCSAVRFKVASLLCFIPRPSCSSSMPGGRAFLWRT